MEIHYTLQGTSFVWNEKKAATNLSKHNGVSFEQAATVFFDPLFKLFDADRNNESRRAIIGGDAAGHLLFVVHVEIEDEFIRIISARRATNEERRNYEHS